MAYTMRNPQIKIDPEDLVARIAKMRRMKLTADRQVESNA